MRIPLKSGLLLLAFSALASGCIVVPVGHPHYGPGPGYYGPGPGYYGHAGYYGHGPGWGGR